MRTLVFVAAIFTIACFWARPAAACCDRLLAGTDDEHYRRCEETKKAFIAELEAREAAPGRAWADALDLAHCYGLLLVVFGIGVASFRLLRHELPPHD